MNRKPKGANLISAVLITLLAMAFALIGEGLFRALFGMMLLFVLPGYALMAAWFPKRLIKSPGNILFVMALSLSITSLGGLVLNVTPWGLQSQSWSLGLGLFTLVNLGIAWWHGEASFVYLRDKSTKLPGSQMAMLLCALGISIVALQLGRHGAQQQNQPAFTQLWMLPADNAHVIEVGVTNSENQSVSYKLLIKDNARVIEETFELAADATWEKQFELSEGTKREVHAYLSRLDMPHRVYRSTSLWLPYAES